VSRGCREARRVARVAGEEVDGFLGNPFPTKRHWRGKSRIADIEAGLETLAGEIRKRGIRSTAVPPLGSGLGGLDWRLVRPQIETALGMLDGVRAVVFEPHESVKLEPSPQGLSVDRPARCARRVGVNLPVTEF